MPPRRSSKTRSADLESQTPRSGLSTTPAGNACPECSEKLKMRSQPKPHMQKKAVLLLTLAVIVTPLWFGAWYLSPFFIVPLNPGGVALCIAIYLAPAIVLGAMASRLPRVRDLRCSHCGWAETVAMRDGGQGSLFDSIFGG